MDSYVVASSLKLNLSKDLLHAGSKTDTLVAEKKFKATMKILQPRSQVGSLILPPPQAAVKWETLGQGSDSPLRTNLISTKVSAIHCKSMQFIARLDHTEWQVGSSFQLASLFGQGLRSQKTLVWKWRHYKKSTTYAAGRGLSRDNPCLEVWVFPNTQQLRVAGDFLSGFLQVTRHREVEIVFSVNPAVGVTRIGATNKSRG